MIKKGTILRHSNHVGSRDPLVFKNPTEFDISRYSAEKKVLIPKFQFLPFGAGKRSCIGRHLGEVGVKLISLHLLRWFDIEGSSKGDLKSTCIFSREFDHPVVGLKLKRKD